jgi:Copper amine oxidase N-terminal domain.
MKKFGLKKGITLCISIILLIALFAVPASASTASRQATLEYNNIKITLDGKEITPKDVNGNAVEPFTIDGSTYLPVRAVANALNLGVEWDGDTSTVILTSPSMNAVSVVDASLFDEDDDIKIAIRYKNNLDVDITKVSISIYGFDKDKKPIMNGTSNVLRLQTNTTVEPGQSSHTRWRLLPELPGTAYVEFAVTSYITADGTVVDIPFDQQIRNSVSK